MRRSRDASGFTIVELVLVVAVLGILTALAFPSARYAYVHTKELELRAALRELRGAIDEYKRWSDAGLIAVTVGSDGYPPGLAALVEGVEVIGQVDKKMRFLRRVPVDPMTGESEWGLRSYQDDPDAGEWGGENVFDVRSLSPARALDGTEYATW